MLTELRKRSRSTIIYVLFAIIILAFILTFNIPGSDRAGCGGGQSATMAEAAGVTIDAGVLQMGVVLTPDPPHPGQDPAQAMMAQQIYERSRFARANPDPMVMTVFGPAPEEISPFKYYRVMEDLFETYLVSAEAEKMGLGVTDEELKERIYQNPFFMDAWYDEDARFDNRQFLGFVRRSLGTTASQYEDFIRREIMREKLIMLLANQVTASDREVDYHWHLTNDKVDLAFVELDPAVVGETVVIPSSELMAAMAERKERIDTHYEEHRGRYEKEERVRIHGIFVQAPVQSRIDRTEDEAARKKLEEERTAAKTKADEALAKLRDAAKKAAEARATAAAGAAAAAAVPAPASPATPPADKLTGDALPGATATVGENPPPAPAPAPAPVAPAAPVDTKPAGFVPVDDFETVAKESSGHLATKDAGGDFAEWKPRSSLTVWPFGEGVDGAVLALAVGQVSDVIEVPNGFWILRLDDKKAAERRSLEDVRGEIARALLIEERAAEATKALAEAFYAQAAAAKDTSLDDLVAQWNEAHPVIRATDAEGEATPALTVRKTGAFALTDSPSSDAPWGNVPMIGADEKIARAAFSLTAESPLAGELFEVKRGETSVWYVIRLAERVPADDVGAEDAKKELRDQLVGQRQRARYRAWYQRLRQQAEAAGDISWSEEFNTLVEGQKREYEAAQKRRLERALGGIPAPVSLP